MHHRRLGHAGKRLLQVTHSLVHVAAAARRRGDPAEARPPPQSTRPTPQLGAAPPGCTSNMPRTAHRPLTRKRSARRFPDPEALSLGSVISGRRKLVLGLPRSSGLYPALAAAAMGKKHKKHKAEWRSSYEGAGIGAGGEPEGAGLKGRAREKTVGAVRRHCSSGVHTAPENAVVLCAQTTQTRRWRSR